MALRKGDKVVAEKQFGGILRERVPAGACGRVESAPWLGPERVTFDLYDSWRGHRKVTVEVQPGEVRLADP
jgi:hypothetical protein